MKKSRKKTFDFHFAFETDKVNKSLHLVLAIEVPREVKIQTQCTNIKDIILEGT